MIYNVNYAQKTWRVKFLKNCETNELPEALLEELCYMSVHAVNFYFMNECACC